MVNLALPYPKNIDLAVPAILLCGESPRGTAEVEGEAKHG